MSTYHVTYDRDETGWWVASVRHVRGCHTQGRTVEEARRRIRQALELWVDDAASATLMDDVRLPAVAVKAIRAYATSRERADRENRRAADAARQVVRLLRGGTLKMSARDTAKMLGLSHQRVHQLANMEVCIAADRSAAAGARPVRRPLHKDRSRDRDAVRSRATHHREPW